jgi:hypothetical protein
MLNFLSQSFSSSRWPITIFMVFGFLLWIPSLFVPFWGDDYFFLTQARASRLNDNAWWLPFITPSETGFWRPLSMDTGWRFVEQVLQGDLLSAHIYSWCLTLLSLAGITFFSYQIARAMQWQNPVKISLLAAAIHAVHIVTYLPLHWVAAMNNPTLVFFVSVTLAVWIALPGLDGTTRWLALFSLPILQLLSLFSKEPAILIPALVVLLSVFLRRQQKYKTADILVWFMCSGICLAWLVIYKEFTPNRHSAYDLVLEKNLLVNSVTFSAWFFNVPREALRMIINERYLLGCLWAAACFIPMAIVYWVSFRTLKFTLSLTQWLAAFLIVMIAYGPYFVLAEQSYEYYAAIAMIFPLLLVARALMIGQLKLGLLLIGISSLIAVQGTRSAEYPALIDRAYWAEKQIEFLQQQSITPPLLVSVSNEHKFAALGVLGIEWRLRLPKGSVILTHQCEIQGNVNAERILVQGSNGDFYWQDCP